MQNTRLVKILKELEIREMTRFKELVFSDYFNKNKKVRQLCSILMSFRPEFEHPSLSKKGLFKQLYGDIVFNELKLNNIISDLLQLLYEFLSLQQYQKKQPLKGQFLLAELLDRELHQHLDYNVRRVKQKQQKSSYLNFEFYLENYHLFDQLDRYALAKGKRGYDEHLQLKNDALDHYYLANKFRIACDMTSRNIVINAGYQCHFLEDILRYYHAEEYGLAEIPALQLYFKTLQMLLHPEEREHYFELKRLLEIHVDIFPQWELRILYNYALNHCVRMINSGYSTFYREILDLYKVLLERKIIFKNNYLTQWSYINIVTAGIRLKDYDWTEHFIQSYKDYLLPEVRHNVYTYNLVALYFERKDYQQALQLLHTVEFTDAFYHLSAKIIQLKSYYELDEMEAFFALVEATKKYLTRNRQLSTYQKTSNANFLKVFSRIYNLRLKALSSNSKSFQNQWKELEYQLINLEPLGNKSWLEEALNDLRKL